MSEEKYEYLKAILGQSLVDIGRATDMVWLSIGEITKIINYKGEVEEKSTYAIHLQCPWRITDGNKKILFASYDVYYPNSLNKTDENFDWSIQGTSLFDEKAKEWMMVNPNIIISKLVFSENGDLMIIFSNDNLLEIFINAVSDTECWRFFKCGSRKKHLVVTGKGITYQ